MKTNEAQTTIDAGRAAPDDRNEVAFNAARRWTFLDLPESREELFDAKARGQAADYQNNIESYIGTVSVPVGLAGPLRIHGESGTAEFRVPLATTEAALVASYNRGARLLTDAGGCTARVVDEGVSRTPMFAFATVVAATRFAEFVTVQSAQLEEVVAGITSH